MYRSILTAASNCDGGMSTVNVCLFIKKKKTLMMNKHIA